MTGNNFLYNKFLRVNFKKTQKSHSTCEPSNLSNLADIFQPSSMSLNGPVLYKATSNRWELGYHFENKIEAINYLVNQNDEKCYDEILEVNQNQSVSGVKIFIPKTC